MTRMGNYGMACAILMMTAGMVFFTPQSTMAANDSPVILVIDRSKATLGLQEPPLLSGEDFRRRIDLTDDEVANHNQTRMNSGTIVNWYIKKLDNWADSAEYSHDDPCCGDDEPAEDMAVAEIM